MNQFLAKKLDLSRVISEEDGISCAHHGGADVDAMVDGVGILTNDSYLKFEI